MARASMSIRSKGPAGRCTLLLAFVCGILLVGNTFSHPLSAADLVPAKAILCDGQPVIVSLAAIDAEQNWSLQSEGKLLVVSSRDLVRWGNRRDRSPTSLVILRDGSQLVADVISLADDKFTLGDATGLGRSFWEQTSLAKNEVQTVFFHLPVERSERAKLMKRASEHRGATDLLLLVGGEQVEGKLLSLPQLAADTPLIDKTDNPQVDLSPPLTKNNAEEPTPPVVKIQLPQQTQVLAIPAQKVIGVVLGTSREVAKTAETPAAAEGAIPLWISLIDGSLICAKHITTGDQQLSLTLSSGTLLSARLDDESNPLSIVEAIEPDSPRITYLSDQKPILARHIPLLSGVWPLGVNTSAEGTPLVAKGEEFRKGLGVHSASSVVYSLDGTWQRFEAELAIDDEAADRGSVTYKVLLADEAGKWNTAYESPIVRGGEAPIPISLPLGNARRIALLVDFADQGDSRDLANWLNARVVKE